MARNNCNEQPDHGAVISRVVPQEAGRDDFGSMAADPLASFSEAAYAEIARTAIRRSALVDATWSSWPRGSADVVASNDGGGTL
jgi:hypothetical protein